MALQQTPPLGWPHTEAQKYQQGEPVPATTPVQVTPPGVRPRRRGCCCGIVLFLLVLAVFGVALAVALGVASLDTLFPGDDLQKAEDAFLEVHPAWTVESADYPEAGASTVRLVAWDNSRGIGRLVFMDPDPQDSSAWTERPLMPGTDTAASEALLDAFAETFSATEWSYLRVAEPVDLEATPEQWVVWYRIWGGTASGWTGLLEASAARDAGTGAWIVYVPESESQEATSAP